MEREVKEMEGKQVELLVDTGCYIPFIDATLVPPDKIQHETRKDSA